MKQNLSISQLKHQQILNARAKHYVFQRETVEEQRISMRRAGHMMWPLVATAMADRQLPSHTELDTPSKRVLFKLSHPEFDWDAFDLAVRRDEAGIILSSVERDAHILRAQRDADALSGLTGSDFPISHDGVLPQTSKFNRSLDRRRRFLLWAAFQDANFDAVSKQEGDQLISVYRDWTSEKVFYACHAMDKLVAYLRSLPAVEIGQLRARYKADRLPLNRVEWRSRKPVEILAAAIMSATIVNPSKAIFRENAKLATKFIKAYDMYTWSSRKVNRCHPNAVNSNALKLKEFRRGYRA
jgi:hypothetical protein